MTTSPPLRIRLVVRPVIRTVALALIAILAFAAALTPPPVSGTTSQAEAEPTTVLARTRGPGAISFNGPARTGTTARGHDAISFNGPARTGVRLP